MNERFHKGAIARSDALKDLRPILAYAAISIPEFPLVIDTNMVLKDLIWLCKHRKNIKARTRIQELLDSTLVILHVPRTIEKEVCKHLPRLSIEQSVSLALLESTWNEYKQKLRFHSVRLSKKSLLQAVDPDDLPFVLLSKNINAPCVLSEDPHISLMGAQRCGVELLKDLQAFARSKAKAVTMACSAFVWMFILGVVLIATMRGLLSIARRHPLLALLLTGVMAYLVFANVKHIRKVLSNVPRKLEPAFNAIGWALALYQREEETSGKLLKRIGAAFA